ncbi:MAG: hypothetical protein ABIK28_25315, partial [Planctomycetota bacterium]
MKRDKKQPLSEIETLVRRAQAGDHEAILALYILYEDQIIAEIRQKMGLRLRSQMESMDLMQSFWGDVLGDLRDFEYQGPDSFTRWLNTCLRNKIRDKVRYYKAGKRNLGEVRPLLKGTTRSVEEHFPCAMDPTPSREAITREEVQRLLLLVGELPELQREVIT